MDKLNNILGESLGYQLSENFRLLREYKTIVNEAIVKATSNVYIKNKILFIYAKDNNWAQQINYYNKEIVKQLKVKGVEINKIIVTAEEEEDEENNKNKKKNKCVKCGTFLIANKQKLCSMCSFEKSEDKRREIRKLLNETPWISYKEIKIDILYEVFMKEKKFKKDEIYDKIINCFKEYKKSGNKELLNVIKLKTEEYVLMKCEIKPENMTEDIIINNISARMHRYYIEK